MTQSADVPKESESPFDRFCTAYTQHVRAASLPRYVGDVRELMTMLEPAIALSREHVIQHAAASFAANGRFSVWPSVSLLRDGMSKPLIALLQLPRIRYLRLAPATIIDDIELATLGVSLDTMATGYIRTGTRAILKETLFRAKYCLHNLCIHGARSPTLIASPHANVSVLLAASCASVPVYPCTCSPPTHTRLYNGTRVVYLVGTTDSPTMWADRDTTSVSGPIDVIFPAMCIAILNAVAQSRGADRVEETREHEFEISTRDGDPEAVQGERKAGD